MSVLKKLYCDEETRWNEGIHTFKSEEFEIIDILSKDYPIYKLCELIDVSRAGYYKWKKHEPTNRDVKKSEILSIVKEVHEKHSTHGYRWTAAFIRLNYGYDFSDNYIYKAFQTLGIKAETTHRIHSKPRKVKDKYPNLIFTT